QFGHPRAQLLLVGGGDPQVQGGPEQRPGEQVHQAGHHRAPLPGPGAVGEEGAQGGGAFLGDVLDGRGEQVLAGREVVLGGAPRHPGPFGHHGDRRARPAVFGEAGHRGLQQALPGGPAAVLFGDSFGTVRRAHTTHVGSRRSRKAVIPSRAWSEANSPAESAVRSAASRSKFSSTLAVSSRFVAARASGEDRRSPSRTGARTSSTSAPDAVSRPMRAASAASKRSPVR